MDWNIDIAVRLTIAAILGAVVGLERERMNRAAGLRTHVMVSLGSALFTVLSVFAFREIGKVNDPARIAAQIVSGIGFLGAGTIMKHGATVKGLTTAATLWVVAAIGMASGAGFYAAATATTLVALLTLVFMKGAERALGGQALCNLDVTAPKQPGQLAKIHGVFELLGVTLDSLHFEEDETNYYIRASIVVPHGVSQSILFETLQNSGASQVELSQ